jgi:hypothetical protein
MSELNQDVKPASSTGGVKVDSPSTDEKARLLADNERLKGALSSLQGERDEIKTELQELREIKKQFGELTSRQEARMKELKREGADVESQITEWKKNLLRQNPDAENWFTDVELKLAKATNTAVTQGASQAALERAADLLEELADELSDEAVSKDDMKEFKDMTDEKLLKILKPYMGTFETKSPYLKTKKAYKAWKADYADKKERAASKKKQAEDTLSQEGTGRQSREEAAGDLLNKSGNLNVTERAKLRESLGIMHRAR